METLQRGDKGGLFAGIVVRRNLSGIAKEIIKPLLQRCAIALGRSKGPFADDTCEITRGSHQLGNGHTTRGQCIRSVGHDACRARVFACLKSIPRRIAQRIAGIMLGSARWTGLTPDWSEWPRQMGSPCTQG